MSQKSPPPSGGGGGGQQQDSGMGIFWVLILVAITGFLIWYVARPYIVAAVFFIKSWQAALVGLFTDQLDRVVLFMQTAVPGDVTFAQLTEVSIYVGNYTRYPVAVILVALGISLYFSNIKTQFKRTHSMKSLRDQEQNNWPQIKSVTALNLVDEDITQGPWAAAMSPFEFAGNHKLLRQHDTAEVSESPHAAITAAVRVGEANRIFAMQLGNLWRGPDKLLPHRLALFAVFAARMNHDRDAAGALLKQIAESSGEGSVLNFNGAHQLVHKYINTKKVQKIINSHAYVLTVMASMLQAAREDGVLAVADFLWLKPIDRRLWYMLNNVGRQTAFVEVAGPYAHWLVERELGYLVTPMVEEAVLGLKEAVGQVKVPEQRLREYPKE